MNYKLCRICHQPKGRGRCRPCRLASQRCWRARHRDELKARSSARRGAEPAIREQGRRRQQRWRERDREKYLALKREQSRRRHERERAARRAVDPAYRVKWEAKQRRLAPESR